MMSAPVDVYKRQEYSTGQMNKLVMALGMEPFKWLKVGWTGMAALLVLACWRWTGVNTVSYTHLIWAIRPYVFECQGDDPVNDKWIEKGKMQRADGDEFSFEAFSLDATVFEVNNVWYLSLIHICFIASFAISSLASLFSRARSWNR